jgi:Flp pilus assembly protein TadG
VKNRRGVRSRSGRTGERGQTIVVFALALVALVAMAGLLVDGGLAWSNRRQAQAAADTAALAAANAAVTAGDVTAAARNVALLNGFTAGTDCNGNALPNSGVTVNRPPTTGPHAGQNDYVEVVTTRKMTTTFSRVVGQTCWMVTARAVASIGSTSVAQCSFCSLNRTDHNHTLVLKNGATLRVDGDIYVNSTNGGTSPSDCQANDIKNWKVCGDGFDIFGAGGSITARTISVTGGWETHDSNPTKADHLATTSDGTPCALHPDPPSQTNPWLPSNVCIHMPQITDPLNDPAKPQNIIPVPPAVGAPVAGVNGCPSGAIVPTGTLATPVTLTINAGSATICPGTYFGGVRIGGSAKVAMVAGVYYMGGGGFKVFGSASINGSAGVMIYNSSGTVTEADSTFGGDLIPPGDKLKKDPKGVALTASPSKNLEPNDLIALTLTVKKNGLATPTGTVVFFEGDTPISDAGCSSVTLVDVGGGTATATCTTSWSTYGSKAVSAVYYGDTNYNGAGDTLLLNINAPAGSPVAPIDIETTGSVTLYGPASGVYKGLTLFQDRASALTITLSPGPGSAPSCIGNWLTKDVPDQPNVDPPDACGSLGGLRGTIYAPNDSALVYITASGLANLQVIAGKIQIDSNADARFAFTPQFFASGNVRLIE